MQKVGHLTSARVAIIGSGNIGTDLMLKARKSGALKVTHMIGRRDDSPGLARAQALGVATSSGGLEALERLIDSIDVIFDATSAHDHLQLAASLSNSDKLIVNLTPAKTGEYYVPHVTQGWGSARGRNLNMVTCGGQTSIPLIHQISNTFGQEAFTGVELASTLASKSAGPATRANLDEYVQNTSQAIESLCGIPAKVLLALNPAKPEPVMRSSVYLKSAQTVNQFVKPMREVIREVNDKVQAYCSGYRIREEVLVVQENVLKLQVEVTSTSESFPIFAGNLDIINTAAIRAAEELAGRIGHNL